MNGREFKNSQWCREAGSSSGRKKVSQGYKKWIARIKKSGIVNKAKQLYDFFKSDDVALEEKLLAGGALLYIIAPVDMMPDGFPVIGWLDDLGVATFALNYINDRLKGNDSSSLLSREIEGAGEAQAIRPDMANPASVTLGEYDFPEKLKRQIDDLHDICEQLNYTAGNNVLYDVENKFSDLYVHRVAFIGHFSTGKSTIINRLIGRDVLPTDWEETTNVITYVMKGNNDLLCSESAEGQIVLHDSIDKALFPKDKVLSSENAICLTLRNFPYEKATFVDTPGLQGVDSHLTRRTKQIISECDVIVVTLDANEWESKDEFEFITSLYGDEKERKLFFVLNKSEDFSEDELNETKKSCEAELISRGIEHQGVYLISAEQGEANSGYRRFREALSAFISRELRNEAILYGERQVEYLNGKLMEQCRRSLSIIGEQQNNHFAEIARKQHEQAAKVMCHENSVRDIQSKFETHFTTFFIEFKKLKNKLKAEVQSNVNSLSIPQLKAGNNIAFEIEKAISDFVEQEAERLGENFKGELECCKNSILSELRKLEIKADVYVFNLKPLADVAVPAVIVGKLLVGENVAGLAKCKILSSILNSDIEKFLSTAVDFSDGVVKAKLVKKYHDAIDKQCLDIEQALEEHFKKVSTEFAKKFDSDFRRSLPIIVMDEDSFMNRKAMIENTMKRLSNI